MTPILVYAWEVQAGDLLDKREVVGIRDDDTTVTVLFVKGDPASHPRAAFLTVQRQLPEAYAIINGSDGTEEEAEA